MSLAEIEECAGHRNLLTEISSQTLLLPGV